MKKTDIKRQLWENVKQEMRSAIVQRAKQRDKISYSELLETVTVLPLDLDRVDHRNIMAEMLGEISLAEDKAGRGMLSALVVHKTGDREPGQGFFEYAEVLGKDISDRLAFWVVEMNKVHDYWSTH